jgi:hypothetical protein
MTHVLQVLFLSVFILQVVMHGEESQVPGDLGTAMPYGCNDNIKGVGNLSSPGCNEINVMSLFNTIPRTKRFGVVRFSS